MRAVLLAVTLAFTVGCGSTVTSERGKEGEKEKAKSDLPTASATLRASIYDVYSHYVNEKSGTKHPHEGKRMLLRLSIADNYGLKTNGQFLVLVGSSQMFQRPQIVVSLKNDRGFKTGDILSELYAEGVVRGPVAFTAKPWAKDWLKLTVANTRLPDQFVYVDDAVLVASPD